MPYLIRELEGKHCLFRLGPDGQPVGDALGNHASAEQAARHRQALQATDETKALTGRTGIIVAFFLPSEVAGQLAFPAGAETADALPPGELHLTLAYLGSLEDASAAVLQSLNSEELLVGALRAFAAQHGPITGRVNGVGRFAEPDEQGRTCFYATFDSPELPAFRQALVDILEGAGFPISVEHGFTPHITLAWLPADAPTPALTPPDAHVEFRQITLGWGDHRTVIELAPGTGPNWSAGNTLKAVRVTDDELRVANYMVLWNSRDLEGISTDDPQGRGGTFERNADGSRGEWFTKATRFDSDYTAIGRLPVDWEHGRDPDQHARDPRAKAPGRHDVLGYVDWSTARRDDKGLWVERVLNRRNTYMQWLQELVEAGLISNSSEAVPGRVKALPDGQIEEWPLMRDTLTVTPMEPQMALSDNALRALKALNLPLPSESGAAVGAPDPSGARPTPEAGTAGKALPAPLSVESRSSAMNMLEKFKQLVPGLTDEQYGQISGVFELAMADPAAALGDAISKEDADAVAALGDGEYPEGKALTRLIFAAARQVPGVEKKLPIARPRKAVRPPYEFDPEVDPANGGASAPAGFEGKSFDAAYIMRFGDEDAATKAILADAVGREYRQIVWDQNAAFAKYLRGGERALDGREVKALKNMIFPSAYIVEKVKQGYSVAEIKSTMVTAQGTLGGYAVPPQMQANIATRLPGLTAVRGGGATVIDLVAGNGIDIPIYTGGNDRYVGNLRGQWGSETQAPGEQNATLGMVNVNADVYTYKVPMSQSLVEDAANLVALVERDISDTLAIDEDAAFLTGDGAGKPLGILPGGVNALSLTEVVSLAAAALTADGLKALKRGIATQYRKGSRIIANSDTFGEIERLKDGNGRYLFEDLTETDKLLARPISESEAMPDVAAQAYPLIHGDLSGYDIVQKVGMTVQRFQDSNTGPNKVEFHVRRRVGGRLERPWLFAVQKVAAS